MIHETVNNYLESLFGTCPPERRSIKVKRNPGDVCHRCHGKGELECYYHVIGGVCFNCWGQGVELTDQEKQIFSRRFRSN